MIDIVVLGATGFTGRLITKYLEHHPERPSFTLGAAARSKTKLQELKRTLALGDNVQLFQVDVTQTAQVEEVVKSATIIINAIGPYWLWGEAVVKACALYGRHYVDITGETPWIRKMITKYDYVAAKNGAIIVPSCGFDSLPADILVMLANKTLKNAAGLHANMGRSVTAYRTQGGMSGGTLSTILTIIEEVPSHQLIEAMQDYALSPGMRAIDSPSPALYYTVPFTSPTQYALSFPMSRPNRAVVQRTWGLHEYAAVSSAATQSENRETVARETYGPEFTYEEYLVQPWLTSRLPAALVNLAYYTILAILIMFPPARWLLKRSAPVPGQGPSEEAMEDGFIEAINYTSSSPSAKHPPTHVKTILRGRGDPGYLLTAIMISESALAILFEKPALPSLAHDGGILTPASAFGEVIVQRLEKSGRFEFESSLINSTGSGKEERRKTR